MQIESLKIFCDVARTKSFSRSAKENNIGQSAVSQCISQLEKSLKLTLIDRSQRPLELTAQGKTFYEGSKNILEQYQNTVRPMYLQFIEPSKRYADVIVPRGGENRIAIDMIKAKMRELLS